MKLARIKTKEELLKQGYTTVAATLFRRPNRHLDCIPVSMQVYLGKVVFVQKDQILELWKINGDDALSVHADAIEIINTKLSKVLYEQI